MCLDKKEEGTEREVWSILGHKIKLGCLISDATPFEPVSNLGA